MDPLTAAAAKGAVGGAVSAASKPLTDESKTLLKQLAERFRNRGVSFLQDPSEIEAVRKLGTDLEFKKYAPYLRDKDRKIIVRIGIRLRALAAQKEGEDPHEAEARKLRVNELKSKTRRRYGIEGIKLAQAAQAEILGIIIDKHQKSGLKPELAEARIVEMFENITKHVRFIEEGESIERAAEEIQRYIKWEQPPLFFIAASGYARLDVRRIGSLVAKEIVGLKYTPEVYPARIREVISFTSSELYPA